LNTTRHADAPVAALGAGRWFRDTNKFTISVIHYTVIIQGPCLTSGARELHSAKIDGGRTDATPECSSWTRGLLFGIDELADVGTLLVKIGEVLSAKLLVDLELFLGPFFLAGPHIGLAKAIVGVGKIRV